MGFVPKLHFLNIGDRLGAPFGYLKKELTEVTRYGHEIAAAMVLFLSCIVTVRPVSRIARALNARMIAVGRRSVVACLLTAGLSLSVNCFCGLSIREPVPSIHDEFAYLLGADTFAQGRLTNPPHPLHEHFETYHVLHLPTYQSKYPPGQSLSLAAGLAWFDSSIAGVWLTLALATGLTTWMLQTWLPGRWALLGGLWIAINPALIFGWGQTYWGGGVALAGGALLFGGLRRVVDQQHRRICNASLMGMGLVILANSRPYEGLIVAIPSMVVLTGWLIVSLRQQLFRAIACVIIPLVGILAVGGYLMYGYNHAVTGDGLKMPYQVWLQQRGSSVGSTLTSLARSTRKSSRSNEDRRRANVMPLNPDDPNVFDAVADELTERVRHRRNWSGIITKLLHQASIYSGLLFIPAICLIPFILTSKWRLFAFGSSVLVLTGICLNSAGGFSHYTAPAAPLFIHLLMTGFRACQFVMRSRGRVGWRYASLLPLAMVVLLLGGLVSWSSPTVSAANDWNRVRLRLEQKLERIPNNDVILVRYSKGHQFDREWVYNSADIDSQSVVWARDLGVEMNQDVLDYYPDRQAWLVIVGSDRYDAITYEEYLQIRSRQLQATQ